MSALTYRELGREISRYVASAEAGQAHAGDSSNFDRILATMRRTESRLNLTLENQTAVDPRRMLADLLCLAEILSDEPAAPPLPPVLRQARNEMVHPDFLPGGSHMPAGDDLSPMQRPVLGSRPKPPGRRTRAATGIAVRVLPPAHRARYREEFSSELAELPPRDQAPYAVRLLIRSWTLRRTLNGQPARRSVSIGLILTGTGGAAISVSLAGLRWPGVTLCSILTAAVLWILADNGRTDRLAKLIVAARGKQPGD